MPEHNIHLSVSGEKNSDSQAPSPSMLRRKRLRKSSTGSGSGSTEHTTTGGSEETVSSFNYLFFTYILFNTKLPYLMVDAKKKEISSSVFKKYRYY